jgi:hypothetical protein
VARPLVVSGRPSPTNSYTPSSPLARKCRLFLTRHSLYRHWFFSSRSAAPFLLRRRSFKRFFSVGDLSHQERQTPLEMPVEAKKLSRELLWNDYELYFQRYRLVFFKLKFFINILYLTFDNFFTVISVCYVRYFDLCELKYGWKTSKINLELFFDSLHILHKIKQI